MRVGKEGKERSKNACQEPFVVIHWKFHCPLTLFTQGNERIEHNVLHSLGKPSKLNNSEGGLIIFRVFF